MSPYSCFSKLLLFSRVPWIINFKMSFSFPVKISTWTFHWYFVCVCVKVTQSCLTICNPIDYTVHGILQARILEWVAFPFSRDLLNPGTEPRSPALRADSLPAEPQVHQLAIFMKGFPV